MTRFGFTIRTRLGQRVDNIQILAATAEDAERRLVQMYQRCEIVERRENSVAARRSESMDVEGIIGLIAAQDSVERALRRG